MDAEPLSLFDSISHQSKTSSKQQGHQQHSPTELVLTENNYEDSAKTSDSIKETVEIEPRVSKGHFEISYPSTFMEDQLRDPVKTSPIEQVEDPSTQCQICGLLLLNPEYMQQHMEQTHAEEDTLDLEHSKEKGGIKCAQCGQWFSNEHSLRSHILQAHVYLSESLANSPNPPSPKDSATEFKCYFCQQQSFESDLALQTHLQENHLQDTSDSAAESFRKLNGPNSRMLLVNGGSLASEAPTDEGFQTDGSKVFNSDAFCEICNREFCNKYFLKTHKANKHSRLIADALLPSFLTNGKFAISDRKTSGNKSSALAVISNDTSISAAVKKETGSPLQLDTKSGVHNSELSSKGLTAAPEQSLEASCPFCAQTFKDPNTMQAHIYYVHANLAYTMNTMMQAVAMMGFGTTMIPWQTNQSEALFLEQAMAMGAMFCNGQQQNRINLSEEYSSKKSTSPPLEIDKCNVKANIHENIVSELKFSFSEDTETAGAEAKHLKADSKSKFCNKLNSVGDIRNFQSKLKSESLSPNQEQYPFLSWPTSTDGDDNQTIDGNSHSLLSHNTAPSDVDPDAYCNICKKEFCSKYFLRTHKLNIHGISTNSNQPTHAFLKALGGQNASPVNAADLMSDATSLNRPKEQAKNCQQVLTSCINIISGSIQTSSPTSLSSGKKNFCDLCNKELCNKYFLRTHMAKMHGLRIDENKVIIGTVTEATRVGGFKCDVCQKELSSRHFLQVHRENQHGIREEPNGLPGDIITNSSGVLQKIFVPKVSNNNLTFRHQTGCTEQPSEGEVLGDETSIPSKADGTEGSRYFTHFTEVCLVCERRFKSAKWLQHHMINDHPFLSRENATDTENFQCPIDLSKLHVANHACDYCDKTFADMVSLQMHVICTHQFELQENMACVAHQAVLDSYKFGSHAAEQSEESVAVTKEFNSGETVMKYDGKCLSKQIIQERRHFADAKNVDDCKAMKKYTCRYCCRSYQDATLLERHVMCIHRFSGVTTSVYSTCSLSKHRTKQLLKDKSSVSRQRYGSLNAHSKLKNIYRCKLCGHTFTNLMELHYHLRAFHKHKLFAMKKQLKTLNVQQRPKNYNMNKSKVNHRQTPNFTKLMGPQLPEALIQSFLLEPTHDSGDKPAVFAPGGVVVYFPVKDPVCQSIKKCFKLTPMQGLNSTLTDSEA